MTNDTFISLQILSLTNQPYFEALTRIYIYTAQVIYVAQDKFDNFLSNKLLIVKSSLLILLHSTNDLIIIFNN